jgi:hypothetical protein
MGPFGRVVATIVFLLTVPGAMSGGAFLYVLFFPVTAFVVLPAIWAKGWIVPGETDAVRPATTDKPDPHPEPAMTKTMLAWRCIWIAGVFVACLIFAYSPSTEARAGVLALAAVIGIVAFWRSFFVR